MNARWIVVACAVIASSGTACDGRHAPASVRIETVNPLSWDMQGSRFAAYPLPGVMDREYVGRLFDQATPVPPRAGTEGADPDVNSASAVLRTALGAGADVGEWRRLDVDTLLATCTQTRGECTVLWACGLARHGATWRIVFHQLLAIS
jgi:hypothetical protein